MLIFVQLLFAAILLLLAYKLLFHTPKKRIEFLNRETAFDILMEISDDNYLEDQKSGICFTWDFIFKNKALKAKNKFENLGYQVELFKEDKKILWSVMVTVEIIYDTDYLMEIEKKINNLVKEFNGIYRERLFFGVVPEYKRWDWPKVNDDDYI